MQQRSIKKNTAYNAIKTVSNVLFPLVTIPYVLRVLLPENVGKINFGLSIISYFSLIASLGITTYAVRECSAVRNDKIKLGETASQIFSINIFTTIIAYCALGLTLLFFKKLANYRLLILIQSVSILATTLGAEWLNSAMEDFKYITIRTFIFQIIGLVLLFIFVHKPDDYLKYAIISLVSSTGAGIVNIWYRKRFCDVHFVLRIDWRRHIVPILLLFVMILAQNIYTNVDSTMLGLIFGDWEVGIYTTAHKMASILFQVIISIAWVVMPRMSAYFAENNFESINCLLRKVFGFYMLVGIPCLVGLGAVANDAIMLVAGSEYQGSVLVLRIFMVGYVFNLFGASYLGNIVLLPSKKEKVYMVICCITAIINVVLNWFFIPLYGPPAAAATTAFCNLMMFIMFIVTKDKRIKLHNVKPLILSPIIGSVCIVIVCSCLSLINRFGIRIITSISVSIIVYVLIQFIGKNELFMSILEPDLRKLFHSFNKVFGIHPSITNHIVNFLKLP